MKLPGSRGFCSGLEWLNWGIDRMLGASFRLSRLGKAIQKEVVCI